MTTTIATLCKSINQKFDKLNVRYTTDGKTFLMRNEDKRFVRMIPTDVVYTEKLSKAKQAIINRKMKEIKNFAMEFGGATVEFEDSERCVLHFENKKGKHSFVLELTVHHLEKDLQANTTQVFIDFQAWPAKRQEKVA